jgi:hypothetical protein
LFDWIEQGGMARRGPNGQIRMTARQTELKRKTSGIVPPPASIARHPKRRLRSSTGKKLEQLFVAFWDLGLENIPEGTFIHRIVPAKEAKRLIDKARKTGTLRCASHEESPCAVQEEGERRPRETLPRPSRAF